MVKLTDQWIDWFVRAAAKGRETPRAWAAQKGVSVRWLQMLVKEFRDTGQVPLLKPNRRPKGTPLTEDEKRIVADAWARRPRGATKVYHELQREGVRIPKHKIHSYLRSMGWSTPNPKKQKKRSRCRYERAHTGSLLHGDWHRTTDQGPHVILWLDDASRCVLSGIEAESPTAELAIQTLEQAIQKAAAWELTIGQVNTDRGSQFVTNPTEGREPGVTQFQEFLQSRGIQHVVSRKGNPQTNGKLERLWLEYDRHRDRFRTLDDWVAWNNDLVHDSLWRRFNETPQQAFQRKLPVEVLVRLHDRLVQAAAIAAAGEVINAN